MKKRLFVVGLTALLSLFYAFQQSIPTAKDAAVRPWVVKADSASQQYLYDSLHYYADQIIQYYQSKGQAEAAREWYSWYFQGIINDGSKSYEEQLAAIEAKYPDIQQSQNPRLRCDYYAAKTEFFSLYGAIDSSEHYFMLAEPLMRQQYSSNQQAYLYLISASNFLDIPVKGKVLWDKVAKIAPSLDPKKDYTTLRTFYQIGSVLHNYLGEYEKSIYINQELLRRHQPQMSHLELASAYCDIAAAYSALEDYQSAIEYYNKAIEYNKYDDVPLEDKAISHYNLAASLNSEDVLYLESINQRNYLESIKQSNKALYFLYKSPISSDVKKNLVMTYCALSHAFRNYANSIPEKSKEKFKQQQLDSMIHYIRKAEKLSLETDDFNLIEIYHLYSAYYKANKNYEKSIDYQTLANQKSNSKFSPKHTLTATRKFHLADIFFTCGNIQTAWHHTQEAWKSIYALDSIPIDFSQLQFNHILHKKRLLNILQLQIKILEASLSDPQNPLRTSYEEIYRYAKLSAQVLEYQSTSFKSEGSKMEKLNKEAQRVYEKAVRLGILLYQQTKDQQYLAEAFRYAEQGKSMLLMDVLQETHAATFAGIPDSLLEKERSLQRQIGRAEKAKLDAALRKDTAEVAAQERLIFEASHEAKALEHRFEKENKAYFDLKYASVIADIPKIQAQLDDKTAILEYVEGEHSIYLFEVTKQKADAHIIPLDSNYQKHLDTLLQSLMDVQAAQRKPIESFNILTQSGHHYHKKLIPALPEGIERLIVIPDGKLSYLPFDILVQKPTAPATMEEEIDYQTVDYLLNRYRINYNYSVTLWMQQQTREDKAINGRMLAMAATYAKDSTILEKRNTKERRMRLLLEELPGAHKEVEVLASHFAGEFYHDQAATESSFKQKAPQFGILHLAMHGLVNSRDPEYSSLAFTENGDSLYDNFLYAYEIKQLGLQAGLVVLSACETGLGKFQRGEGVVSIGRGFMYAGAPSVLMTLWSLNDQSGAMLVQQFYYNLQAGMDKDEAIRQAKLEYVQTHRGVAAHPSLWACFVQVGNYDNIAVEGKGGNMKWYMAGGAGILLLLGGIFWMRKKAD